MQEIQHELHAIGLERFKSATYQLPPNTLERILATQQRTRQQFDKQSATKADKALRARARTGSRAPGLRRVAPVQPTPGMTTTERNAAAGLVEMGGRRSEHTA